jgi:hypothetical protein
MATMNGVSNGVENRASNGVLKRGQQETNGHSQHSAAKKLTATNGATTNGATAKNGETIPGKSDLEFLRNVVDLVIQDGLIDAMDRDT